MHSASSMPYSRPHACRVLSLGLWPDTSSSSQLRGMHACSDGMFEFMSNLDIVAEVHALAQQGLGPHAISTILVSPGLHVKTSTCCPQGCLASLLD